MLISHQLLRLLNYYPIWSGSVKLVGSGWIWAAWWEPENHVWLDPIAACWNGWWGRFASCSFRWCGSFASCSLRWWVWWGYGYGPCNAPTPASSSPISTRRDSMACHANAQPLWDGFWCGTTCTCISSQGKGSSIQLGGASQRSTANLRHLLGANEGQGCTSVLRLHHQSYWLTMDSINHSLSPGVLLW